MKHCFAFIFIQFVGFGIREICTKSKSISDTVVTLHITILNPDYVLAMGLYLYVMKTCAHCEVGNFILKLSFSQ
jgi:hypothetical protein